MPPTIRLMARLVRAIGCRVTDCRLFERQQFDSEKVYIRQHKTGVSQDFDTSVEVVSIFAEAKALRGAVRSMTFMLPTRDAKEYTEAALSRA